MSSPLESWTAVEYVFLILRGRALHSEKVTAKTGLRERKRGAKVKLNCQVETSLVVVLPVDFREDWSRAIGASRLPEDSSASSSNYSKVGSIDSSLSMACC